VENALILGGYFAGVDPDKTSDSAANGNAQLGPITVGGDWFASSVAAGVLDPNHDGFGNGDDAGIVTAGTSVARIASIAIKGTIGGTGTAASGTDHFGFVSREIGTVKALNFVAALTAGTDIPIELSPLSGDVTIREI
jgi:hypothetical protein